MTQAIYTETYIRDPEGPWLVFLHGFGGSTKMWKKQLSFFREQYNLLLLDFPGHGQSRLGISDLNIHCFEDLADVVANTLEHHNIRKACFICVSLGTLVFAALQNKYPELVIGGILCGAIAGISLGLQNLLFLIDRIKHRIPPEFLLRIFAQILLPWHSHAKSRNFFIESGRLLNRREFLAWFSLIVKDIDILKNLSEELNNVIFISGTEDFTFLRGVKRLTSAAARDVKLILLRRCGHVCSLQRPSEFNSLSMKFLNENLLPETGTT